jgi:hypothetical protein
MNTESARLLKQLGVGTAAPVVRPSGQGVDASAFADLLSRARSGELASNRAVSVAPDAGVALGPDELAKISLAADRAEAAGIRTALVMVGDQRVLLDVGTRTITGAARGEGGVYAGVDGVIDLTAGAEALVSRVSAAGAGPVGLMGAGTASAPGVLRALTGSGPSA